jgi:hypothetical protein
MSLQLDNAAVSATADLAFGEGSEPTLDLIEPRSRGRREVHVEARIAGKPSFDGRSLVGTVIVHHQMHVEFLRHRLFNRVQELQNSCERCRRCNSPMTLPVAMLRAANSVVVPCRL